MRWMAIHLGRPLPNASRDRPGRRRGNPPAYFAPKGTKVACRPYLVLLPVGFTVPSPLPGTRCALTAPFHPCRRSVPRRDRNLGRRFAFCGTVPRVAPAGRYPAPCFRGARTFLPPRNARKAAIRPSGTALKVAFRGLTSRAQYHHGSGQTRRFSVGDTVNAGRAEAPLKGHDRGAKVFGLITDLGQQGAKGFQIR